MKDLKKPRGWLVMAAALILGLSACSSSEDSIIEQPQNLTEPQVYTLVIKATKGGDAQTRALSLDGSTLNAYWSGDETIEVGQGGEKIGEATADPSANGTTTITATLTSAPDPTDDLNFYLGGGTPDYTGQVGLLTGTNSISEKYDYATDRLAAYSYSVDDKNNIVIPNNNNEPLEFVAAQQAIVKFTLKDKGNNDAAINATKLNIHDSKGSLIQSNDMIYWGGPTFGDVTISPATTNVIYAALAGVYQSNLTLTASDGDNVFSYSKSGVDFTSGSYYSITVKMNKILARITRSNASAVLAGGYTAITEDKAKELAKQCWTVAGSTVYVVYSASGSILAPNVSYASYDGTTTGTGSATDAMQLAALYGGGNTAWFVEPTPAPTYTMAKDATANDKGKLICTAGHIHAYNADAECTADRVAKIIYVGATGNDTYSHGLALAMSDAGIGKWGPNNGYVHDYKTNNSGDFSSIIEDGLQYNASHNNDSYPAFMNAIANNGTAVPTDCSGWFLPTGYQWQLMITAAGGFAALRDGFNSVGGTNMKSDDYWSGTEWNGNNMYAWAFSNFFNEFRGFGKDTWLNVRSALAF